MMDFEEAAELERIKAEYAQILEERRSLAAMELANRRHLTAIHQSMTAAASAYANGALRGLFLANGGAIVAVMTFLGNRMRSDTPAALFSSDGIRLATNMFVYGLIACLCAYGTSYLSQVLLLERGDAKGDYIGSFIRVLALACAVTSVGMFGIGGMEAVRALTVFGPMPP